jgi:hypothetical protein
MARPKRDSNSVPGIVGTFPSSRRFRVEGRSALIESLVKIAPEDERVISRLRAIAQDPDDHRRGVAGKHFTVGG